MGGEPLESRVKFHKEIDSCECTLKSNLQILVHIEPRSANLILEESISENILIMEKGMDTFQETCSNENIRLIYDSF